MKYRTPPPEPRPYRAEDYSMDDVRRAFIPAEFPKPKLPQSQITRNKRKGGLARAAQPGAAMTLRHK